MVVFGGVTGAVSSAMALDFSAADLIYEENFVGETGLPTTPEVDVDAFGTLVLVTEGAASLTIAGGEATATVSTPSAPEPARITTSGGSTVGVQRVTASRVSSSSTSAPPRSDPSRRRRGAP
jgi:hypothetical protein